MEEELGSDTIGSSPGQTRAIVKESSNFLRTHESQLKFQKVEVKRERE